MYLLIIARTVQLAFFRSENYSRLQDENSGGISDRPEDIIDAFHTFFWHCNVVSDGLPRPEAYRSCKRVAVACQDDASNTPASEK